jgi:glycosyltransferase involved in cell wall biosynthesis
LRNIEPSVSVIMNCFNGEEFLVDAIDSIYKQTFSDWEIIFFDNASTDRSSDIAKKYDNRLNYYHINNNVPLGKARNLAIEKATGKYIAFLDCDDLYIEDKLEKQYKVMEKNDFIMSYGGAIIINEKGLPTGRKSAKYCSGDIFGNLLKKYEVNMQSVMLLRSYLINNNLLFPEDFQFGPDYDLFMDIASQYEIGVINEIIVMTRVHSGALTYKKLHCVRDELKSTIDRLLVRDPSLKNKYENEIRLAYGKFEYYQAVYFISDGKFNKARKTLQSILTYRWEYFVLYVLLFFPLPKKIVMRLLNR